MPWLADIVTILEGASIGTFNVDIFASSKAVIPLLASGAATVHITATAGIDPENTHNATIRPAYVQPGAQVVVRSTNPLAADATARLAYDALFAVRNQFVNSGWYKWIRPQQEPFDAGVDDQGRVRVAFNVIANKRP